MKKRLADFAAYCLVRVVVAVIQVLPYDMGNSICHGLAWLLTGPISIRRRTTDANLRLIFPQASEAQYERLRYEMWHSLLLTTCEVAWASRRLHRCNWSKHLRYSDNQTILRHLLSPRASLMVTGHYGNFEVSGHVSGLMGFETLSIARRLDNEYLHRWVERFRGSNGQYFVDKEGCAREVESHLAGGGILSLLADQHAGEKGCWTDFMGAPASCHKALALFSFSANAPMFVAVSRRLNGKPMQFQVDVTGVLDPSNSDDPAAADVTSMTRWYNESLAAAVAKDVSQYWWLHRRWRTPPAKVLKRLAKRSALRAA